MSMYKLREYLLHTYDPDDILFLLNISTEELLDKFDYLIEEKYDKLMIEIEEEEEEGHDV